MALQGRLLNVVRVIFFLVRLYVKYLTESVLKHHGIHSVLLIYNNASQYSEQYHLLLEFAQTEIRAVLSAHTRINSNSTRR